MHERCEDGSRVCSQIDGANAFWHPPILDRRGNLVAHFKITDADFTDARKRDKPICGRRLRPVHVRSVCCGRKTRPAGAFRSELALLAWNRKELRSFSGRFCRQGIQKSTKARKQ